MDDEEILNLYWARDERALTETQSKYGNYCHSIVHRILHDGSDTDECLNDTWFRAWNAIPPKRPEKLHLYLGAVARNIALDRLREKKRLKRGGGEITAALDELEDCIPDADSTESVVDAAELQRLLNQFLHMLPERECNVFLRRYWYVETYEEIAARYGMKLNTVKTSLFRTRCKLKGYLEEEGIVI